MVDERIGGWKSKGDRASRGADSARRRQQKVVQRRARKLKLEEERHDDALEGRVIMKTLGVYHVKAGDNCWVCKPSSKLRKRLEVPEADPASIPHFRRRVRSIKTLDPVAVGDYVKFYDNGDETGLVVEVVPRQTKLTRRAAGPRPMEQVIASNVELALPVMSVSEPDPRWNVLDRYLVSAEASNLPVVILVTKCDLKHHDSVRDAVADYRRIGYTVLFCSAETGEGMDAVAEGIHGKTSVFIGKSGVGKSSILNRLDPDLDLPVQAVGERTGKGRHTTTSLTMHHLSIGADVIDTPGMREFGLWAIDTEARVALFPELRPYVGMCRFAHCMHDSEPDCAIKQAVADGKCSERRYTSLLRLMSDQPEG